MRLYTLYSAFLYSRLYTHSACCIDSKPLTEGRSVCYKLKHLDLCKKYEYIFIHSISFTAYFIHGISFTVAFASTFAGSPRHKLKRRSAETTPHSLPTQLLESSCLLWIDCRSRQAWASSVSSFHPSKEIRKEPKARVEWRRASDPRVLTSQRQERLDGRRGRKP